VQAYFLFFVKLTFKSDFSSQFVSRPQNYFSRPNMGSRPIVWEALSLTLKYRFGWMTLSTLQDVTSLKVTCKRVCIMYTSLANTLN